jgi:shikimate dehydrogenase
VLEGLSGATHVYGLVGRHPLGQFKSPAGLTGALRSRGRDAVVVPIHVEAKAVDDLIEALGAVGNLHGILATAPHKSTLYQHAATATERAHLLAAANILRRNKDRSWHADLLDGAALLAAIESAGCKPARRRALLAGAGVEGSAIAIGLLDAKVASLSIHDIDEARRDALIGRLQERYGERVAAGSADPAGFTLIVNATPAGTKSDDALPFSTDHLTSEMFVADMISRPALTPLLDAAQRAGCGTQTGAGVLEAELALTADFLLGSAAQGRRRRA